MPWLGLPLILLCSILFAPAARAADPRIAEIRDEYLRIRSRLPKLQRVSVDAPGYSTEGGHAWAFRDEQNRILLLRVEFFGENGAWSGDFYYRPGELIFCYVTSRTYNAPMYLTHGDPELGIPAFDPAKTRTGEDRYYFSGGKLIRWLDERRKSVDRGSPEFAKEEERLLRLSGEVLLQFAEKD